MINWIKNKWHNLSYLGVKPEFSLAVQKRIVLSNQLAIVAFVSIFTMSSSSFEWNNINLFIILNYLSISSILSVLIMNKMGHYKITSITLSVLTPVFTLIFSSASLQYHESLDINNYFSPRILLISELCLPLILIDFKRKKTIIITLLINLSCIFLFDPLLKVLHLDIFQVKSISYFAYYQINFFIIFPISIMLFSFYFLMDINSKYEDKIFQLVSELTEKNNILSIQKEEITTQLEEISEQKETIQKAFNTIEIKNKKITDSINYAQKIQNAVLPSKELIDKILPEYFILFKPRDIVSGDFYFIQKINHNVIVIAADCTGHGVPGAFMSMLGLTMINELIRKNDDLSPAILLNNFREKIKNSLQQTGQQGEQQDGMDIAFCVINTENNVLKYAGAYNPCWIFRNANPQGFKNLAGFEGKFEFIELPADRQPVGIYLKEKPFTEHQVQLYQGDTLYIFSDGYTSQFGGENEDKFKNKRFQELLKEISQKNINEQQTILDQTLSNWRGNQPQTDDVLVIGLHIS